MRGQPGHLSLVSDLAGIGLTIPEVGWSKPKAAKGQLTAEVRLGKPPLVESIALKASGLDATGSVTMRAGGGLDVAKFNRVRLGEWLDAPLEITGRGQGKPVGLALTGGSGRYAPDAVCVASANPAANPAAARSSLRLERLQVSQSIALTSVSRRFLAGRRVERQFHRRRSTAGRR